jgi:hypothetical protein
MSESISKKGMFDVALSLAKTINDVCNTPEEVGDLLKILESILKSCPIEARCSSQ